MDDLLDILENEDELRKRMPKPMYFGQFHYTHWECVFEKGIGKAPFEPSIHDESRKFNALRFEIEPLPTSNAKFTPWHECVAESREYLDIFLPSLKALKIRLSSIQDKWVQYEDVQFGTYVSREGEEKPKKMFKILAVFDTLEEAETAAANLYGNGGNSETEPVQAKAENDARRKTADQFLQVLVKQSQRDLVVLEKKINDNPLVKEFFNVDSPRVIELLVEQEQEQKQAQEKVF